MSDPTATPAACSDTPSCWSLRDLSLPTRLVIALFLSSVGFGYLSAMVQLHFQGAAAGKPLPGPKEVVAIYYGEEQGGPSQLERLLMTDETKPFSGSGSMRSALTTRSGGNWRGLIQKRATADRVDLVKAERDLRAERDGEAAVIVDWIRSGADKESYEKDEYSLNERLLKALRNRDGQLAFTEKYIFEDDKGVKKALLKTMLEHRCVRCHATTAGSRANQFPLEQYEQVKDYCDPEGIGGGMSLKKLAQTTHVHLLGFSMLYGLTGVIFSLTRYPGWLRVILSPLPLLAQLADISCWWLGRFDPNFAKLILVTGGIVGMSLAGQIVLSLWDLFDRHGRKVLIVLALLVGATGVLIKERLVDRYLEREGLGAAATERTAPE